MMRSVRFMVVVLLAAMTLALPAATSAAPTSTSFAVTGFEYAFTPTVGFFTGSATGNAGDSAIWNTYVEHDVLGSTPTYINGGSFWMATRSQSGTYDWVIGTFVPQGGTIETVDEGANCTNQQYLVTGMLENVSTSNTFRGTGTFSVTLTHYRTQILGRCVAYRATVVGTVSFTY